MQLPINTLPDECNDYTLKKDEVRRSVEVTLQAGDTSISDNFMTDGWYRFESGAGNDMTTTAPSVTACGTMFPIWLQGSVKKRARERRRHS